jgi:hypothetical protein
LAPSFPARDEDSGIATRKDDRSPSSPRHLATDLDLRRRDSHSVNDLIDMEEILGFLTLALSMADVKRRDQLVIARPIRAGPFAEP